MINLQSGRSGLLFDRQQLFGGLLAAAGLPGQHLRQAVPLIGGQLSGRRTGRDPGPQHDLPPDGRGPCPAAEPIAEQGTQDTLAVS
jgi:hypothetical protein